MRNPIRKKALVSVLALITLTTLAACSKQPKAVKKPSLRPVSLQLEWVTQAEFAGYYVALGKGWYRDEGIDLTIKPGGPDLNSAELVADGASDFGTATLVDLSTAIDKYRQLVCISQIQRTNRLLLISRKSSGIKKPKDLVGKKVGIWFGGWEAQFDALMAKEGIPLKDINLVSQGWSMDPFLKGDLDVASAMSYNEYQVVLEHGIKPEDLNVIDFADYSMGFPGHSIFTTRKLVSKDPDICVRMLRASLKGWQYAIDHPKEAVDIVMKYDKSGVQKLEHQLVMMREVIKLIKDDEHPLGQIDGPGIVQMLATFKQSGILSRSLKPEDIYTNDIWEKTRLEK